MIGIMLSESYLRIQFDSQKPKFCSDSKMALYLVFLLWENHKTPNTSELNTLLVITNSYLNIVLKKINRILNGMPLLPTHTPSSILLMSLVCTERSEICRYGGDSLG